MQTAALILGILALAFLFVPGANIVLSPMMGIAALVLGLIGRRAALAAKQDAIMGKAGFITGLVALLASLLLIFVLVGLIKGACKDCRSGCDWGKRTEKVEVEFEHLSDEFKKDLREEVRREVAREMERARQERIRSWKNRKPWTDEEWRKAFEERVDEWVEWLDTMPIHKDVSADQEPAPAEPAGEAPEPLPEEKKPAKKPVLLPDTTYPGDGLE